MTTYLCENLGTTKVKRIVANEVAGDTEASATNKDLTLTGTNIILQPTVGNVQDKEMVQLTGTVRTSSVVIQSDGGDIGDFEIRTHDDELSMRFRKADGATQDAMMYREDDQGPKAPSVSPYWLMNDDMQVAGDLLVTGKVVLGAAPSGDNDAVTKAYADQVAIAPASLNDATDVEYTGTPAGGQILAWNGTVWTNKTLKTAYWTEVFHYNGNMSGTPVYMVTGAGIPFAPSLPYTIDVDTLCVSAFNLPNAATHAFTVLVKKFDGTTLATLSTGDMPQVDVLGPQGSARGAWVKKSVTPFTVSAADVIYLQLSDYTGTGIAVSAQLSVARLEN
eukprot:jgi/Mesvir1/1382/Mv22565-RA.1